MGGGSLKKEDRQMGLTQEIVGPNYSSGQAQHNQDSPVSETKEGSPPEELEEQILLKKLEINHQCHKVER